MILQPLSPSADGGAVAALRLEAPREYMIGRANEADWQIMDPSMSRRHALVKVIDGEWYITDLGSRQGTQVNGRLLARGEQARLRAGDLLRFGHWSCRCKDPAEAQSIGISTTVEDPGVQSLISRLDDQKLAGLAQKRLDALLTACQGISRAADLPGVALSLTQAVVHGTGCRRVVVVRQTAPHVYESLGSTGLPAGFQLSRSLLAAAAGGSIVQLGGPSPQQLRGQSIMDLNIQTAICAPIMAGASVEAFLYVDTRESERGLEGDAAAFCRAIAQLGGFAVERLRRTELEEHQRRLEQDLAAARRAQDLLMPSRDWTGPGIRSFFESIPGRLVAGDLFDIFTLDEDRVGFFLGDVSGKGVGAAVLMAATQAKLRTLMVGGSDLAEAFRKLNEYMVARTESGKFITLIAGIANRKLREIRLADAGHGLACLCCPGNAPLKLDLQGGMPIGVDSCTDYNEQRFDFQVGRRLVLFSDGVIEQTNTEGRQFGFDEAMALLGGTSGPQADVSELLKAVQAHAEGQLADDLTIASLAAAEGPAPP